MEKFVDSEICSQQDEDLNSRRAFLLNKLREKAEALSDSIPSNRNSNCAPLSSAQQQLWLISKLGSNSSRSYHESIAFNINGHFNLDAFNAAYQSLLQRHEILSSVIRVEDSGIPYQLFELNLASELEILDFSHIQESDKKRNKFRDFLSAFSERDFDLHNERLIRAAIVQMSETHWSVVLVLHHIVMDGWSIGIMARELSQFYNERVTGKSIALPVLDIQYADFAEWQNTSFVGERHSKDILYWQEKLKNVENLDFPALKVRPHQPSNKGDWVSFKIESEVESKLRLLSKRSKVTLYVILLSVYKVLLFRYTGKGDLCVGTPVANRVRPEIENLIGLFVNTLALRSVIGPDESFLSVIDKVRTTVTEAFKHQELPFERVVSAVKAFRDNSTTPIFQTMLVLQNASRSKLELDGADVEVEHTENIYSKFDISCYLNEISGGGLEGGIEYATDLFDRKTMEQFAQHFVELCRAAVAAPEKSIGDWEFLTETEKHQLLVEWNNTETIYPVDKCIHELFEEQVEKAPHAVAILFEEERLTYRELNEKANQLAHYLVEQGVKPGTLVGICVERSLEMIIGMLGILKAGGAYVPLDPEYPAERLLFMQKDAGLSIVLTQLRLRDQMCVDSFKAVYLDENATQIQIKSFASCNIPAKDLGLNSSHLAYLIYTSGSTGKPKGVMICHSNTNALYQWAADTFDEKELSLVVASTSICFDLSVFEILVSLQLGARVLLVQNILSLTRLERLDGAFDDVSLINTVPSAIKQLLELNAIPSGIQVINLAGEPLKQDLVDALYDHGIPKVYDLYGPSEDTTYSTYTLRKFNGCANIGRPIQNTQAYILSENMQLIPGGCVGELHLGGAGLAQGYLNLPELTQEKFIQNPFSKDCRDRLYKTGDLCRYLPDGNIQYIGRIDHQVKIRGFRIELGEIESVLLSHNSIKDTVVLAKESPTEKDAHLAGYIVSDNEIDISEIRDYLSQTLPAYMIPTTFKVLPELPLTPNGKVDRRALLSLELDRFDSSLEYVAPITETEKTLVAIWASVLGLSEDRIGIEHDFFLLGGHSLLATQVAARLQQQTEKELPLRTFFDSPTIKALALFVDRTSKISRLPPIKSSPGRTQFPLSFAQERLWFLDQFEERKEAYHVPCVYRLHGPLDKSVLEKVLTALVERHASLRTNIYIDDGHPYQVIQNVSEVNLEYFDLTKVDVEKTQEDKCESIATNFINKPFCLATDHLARFALIQRCDEDHTFIMVLHHIITDGWSMGTLMNELSTLYKAYMQGKPNPLTPLLIQYADYAVWQRQTLQGERREKDLQYWKQKLQATTLLEFPTDRSRPPVQSYRGSRVPFEIDKEVSSLLNALSLKETSTLYMTLLAVFKTLLHRYSQQKEICIGTPIANRLLIETEPLVGFFVNTLALKSTIEGKNSFREVLLSVKDTTLKAYEHQSLPFSQVVEAVQPERSQSYAPIFQVMFVLQNTQAGEVKIPHVSVEQEGTSGWAVSKFDFTLTLEQRENGSIGGGIEYATDLFDRETMERFASHFTELCKAVVATPEMPIEELKFLTEKEINQLLVKWNNTKISYPADKCIQELFEAQVIKTPNATALIFEDQQLSYYELNAKANQLAHYLIKKGVKPETLVGICVERSLEMVIGLLGILKAGGAYVPLDPGYPKMRLQYMLEDAGLEIVLTQTYLQQRTDIESDRALYLDDSRIIREMSTLSRENPDSRKIGVGPSNLAYVIYTSGSTGKPKGTMITHSNTCAFFQWAKETYLPEELELVLAATSVCFDLSVFEIFTVLQLGGTVLVIDNVLMSVESKHFDRITLINTVPSAIQELNAANAIPPNIRVVNLAGEPLKQRLVDSLYEKGVPKVFDLYGPSEDTTYSTFILREAGKRPSIGKPIHNTQVYILDQCKALMPIGVVGELVLGGAGLARGYLGNPELTKEKFIQNPFTDCSGDRMYCTGDLARWLPDGNLEYLGRIDHQIKIRGFRVELGEIENTLTAHDDIKDAVILAKDSPAGGKRLVAYIACDKDILVEQGEPQLVSSFKRYLSSRVPDYMVPSTIVILEKLPLTSNGKLDRKSLNDLDVEKPVTSIGNNCIKSPIAIDLCKIWSDLLEINSEMISLESNFFDLGGHSLLMFIMKTKIEKYFKLSIPIPLLYGCENLADLEKIILRENSVEYLKGNYKQDGAVRKILALGDNNDDNKILENLDEYLLKKIKKYNIPGVSTTIFYRDKIYHGNAGTTEVGTGNKVDRDTLFRIGCTMKLFVSVLAMRLVDKNIINLDEPIKTYWPEFRVKDDFATNSISLRHLLTHGSGLDEYKILENLSDTLRNKKELSSLLAITPQICLPGEQSIYCCINFSIVGVLIEKMHGSSLANIIFEDLLKPLGINDFYFPPYAYPENGVAEGYTNDGHAPYNPDRSQIDYNDWVPAMGYGVMTSTQELVKLAIALISNKNNGEQSFLTQKTIDLILQEQMSVSGDPGCRGIGLGWYHFLSGGIGHRGNGIGHQSFLQVVPGKQLAIAFLGNKYPCEQVFAELLFDLVGYDNASADRNGSRVEKYNDCIGEYQHSAGSVVIDLESEKLTYCISSVAGVAKGTLEEMPGTNYFRLEKRHENFGVLGFIIPEGADTPHYLTLWDVFYKRADRKTDLSFL